MSVELHTLSNGFRIVTENMPGLQSASLGIWVMAGGRDERPEQNGIAHFLEHMLFLGTDKYPDPAEYEQYITEHGGTRNAYTSFENTNYLNKNLANHMEDFHH